MRTALADAAGAESRLAGVLLETLDYLDLGDFRAAESRLSGAVTARMVMVQHLDESQRLGLEDLVGRERVLVAAATGVANAVVIWVALGAVLLVLAMLLVRWRFYLPLAALDRGLARVEGGELETELRIGRDDELGRLKAHFDQMTGVLRRARRRSAGAGPTWWSDSAASSTNRLTRSTSSTRRPCRIVQSNRGAQLALGHTPSSSGP